MCGIRPLIIDFFDFDENIFGYLTSVSACSHEEEFKSDIMKGLNEREDFSYDWDILSRKTVFNGRVIENYSHVFNQLMSSR